MKRVAIVTLVDNKNYGNRLQNYALSYYLRELGQDSQTLWIKPSLKKKTKKSIKKFMSLFFSKYKIEVQREKNFEKFTSSNISNFFIKKDELKTVEKYYDTLIFGSDQIWNPDVIRENDLSLNNFSSNIEKISYAASVGVLKVDDDYKNIMKKNLKNFKHISVREESAQKLLQDMTGQKVELNIDPVMLLTSDEWSKLCKPPKDKIEKKYILTYFLGDLSSKRKNEIKKIADAYDCEIINLLDKNNKFYTCGPEEFLYLEQNTFLVCTDSFHSSVFAFIFNRPFIVFDREEEGMDNMGTRLDNLIKNFNLKNRVFMDEITDENLNHDYKDAYKILEIEREKSRAYLIESLDIKKVGERK